MFADTDPTDLVVLAPPVVMLVISVVIPILVGLISKATLSSGWRAVLMLIMNALNAFITTAVAVDGSAVVTKEAFFNFLIGVAISVSSYLGVYRYVGLRPEEKLLPKVGLGPSVPDSPVVT